MSTYSNFSTFLVSQNLPVQTDFLFLSQEYNRRIWGKNSIISTATEMGMGHELSPAQFLTRKETKELTLLLEEQKSLNIWLQLKKCELVFFLKSRDSFKD